MKPRKYWQSRSEQITDDQYKLTDEYADKLERQYRIADRDIQQEVDTFYRRFAKNNGIVSMADARRLLNSDELKEFKMTLEEFTAKAKNNDDGRWKQELDNVYFKTRITRLESLQLQMRHHVEKVFGKQDSGLKKLLTNVYDDTYYRTVFETQLGLNFGLNFAKIDKNQLEQILRAPWMETNYSQKIWANRRKLLRELETSLSQSLISGKSVDKTTKALSERLNVSKTNAKRLVVTEGSYITHQAQADAFESSGVVKQYEFLATLDKRTSTQCRAMDLKVFKLEERQVGVNYPPLHTNCRSTVVPHFGDEEPSIRAAKDEKDKTYYVPSDMKYKDWKERYVDGSDLDDDYTEPVGTVTEQNSSSEFKPSTFNRRYNPKASYYADLPNTAESTLEALSDVNREIVREGHKQGKEIAVFMDKNSGTEMGRLSGVIDKVAFTIEMDKMLREAAKDSVILTHNHPRGTRINVKDMLNLAVYPSISDIIAVGHDGGISFIATNGTTVDTVMFRNVMIEKAKEVEIQLQKDKKYGKMSKTSQLEYWDNQVLMAIANELGWTYVENFKEAREDNRYN